LFLLELGIYTAIACGAAAKDSFVLPRPDLITFQDCSECPPMVMLPSGLSISRTHVTRGQFGEFAKENSFSQGGWGCVWREPEVPQNDNHPVVCVSFRDAQSYAEWLARKTHSDYRLPTLDELKEATLAGEDGPYWWGQSIGTNRANCRDCGSKWDGKGTSPVASFSANPYGVFDSVGNAWQWTSSCHVEPCTDRVLFGGSWSSSPADLKMTAQIWSGEDVRFNTYGIRVVKDAR
jgi:formylglycine-generating enzyme required for sulfatase activity